MKYTNILTIKFTNRIKKDEVSSFRGAVINLIPSENILFHNHTDNTLRYAYPLIQYKRINGCAAIVCINEGIDAIKNHLQNLNHEIRIGNRLTYLTIDTISPRNSTIEINNELHNYSINSWLPLNNENYGSYIRTESLVERYSMLEKIMTGNILSFAKGIEVYFSEHIACKITDISKIYYTDYKNVRMMALNATFKCNATLPNDVGIGKGVSLGHGTITETNYYKYE